MSEVDIINLSGTAIMQRDNGNDDCCEEESDRRRLLMSAHKELFRRLSNSSSSNITYPTTRQQNKRITRSRKKPSRDSAVVEPGTTLLLSSNSGTTTTREIKDSNNPNNNNDNKNNNGVADKVSAVLPKKTEKYARPLKKRKKTEPSAATSATTATAASASDAATTKMKTKKNKGGKKTPVTGAATSSSSSSPKKPRNAYTFFFHQERSLIEINRPHVTGRELGSLIGAAWRNLSQQQKQHFKQLEVLDLQRFTSEKQAREEKQRLCNTNRQNALSVQQPDEANISLYVATTAPVKASVAVEKKKATSKPSTKRATKKNETDALLQENVFGNGSWNTIGPAETPDSTRNAFFNKQHESATATGSRTTSSPKVPFPPSPLAAIGNENNPNWSPPKRATNILAHSTEKKGFSHNHSKNITSTGNKSIKKRKHVASSCLELLEELPLDPVDVAWIQKQDQQQQQAKKRGRPKGSKDTHARRSRSRSKSSKSTTTPRITGDNHILASPNAIAAAHVLGNLSGPTSAHHNDIAAAAAAAALTYVACGNCIPCQKAVDCGKCLPCKLKTSSRAMAANVTEAELIMVCAHRICIDPVEHNSQSAGVLVATTATTITASKSKAVKASPFTPTLSEYAKMSAAKDVSRRITYSTAAAAAAPPVASHSKSRQTKASSTRYDQDDDDSVVESLSDHGSYMSEMSQGEGDKLTGTI